MRIINLELQAFGPFLDKIKIDFEKIGNKGLFLISGQTGAGKTTIFDAIAYALYGKSSGGERDEKMLRFAAATPDIETYVDLEFEYKNEKYKIFRVPKYQRYKKSGEGTTENGTKRVILNLPNGESINDNTLADKYINDLIGVDINQFTQIVMLAQGNFMKLLKSNNDEKEKLFRDIFFTQKYQLLELDIKSKYSEFNKKKEISKTQYEELISNFEFNEEQLDSLKEIKNRSISEVIEYVFHANSILEEKAEKIKNEIDDISKKIDAKKILIEKINNYYDTKKKIEENRTALSNIKDKFENIKDAYSKISIKEDERDKVQIEITKIENEIKRFEKLNKIIEEKKTVIKEKQTLEEKLNNKKLNLDEIVKTKLETEKFLEDNSKSEIELNNVENSISIYNDKLEKSNELLSLINENKKLKEEKKVFIEEFEIIKLDKERKQKIYEDIDERYFYSIAGILAKDLNEDEPCPVCGSLHHPDIAHFTDEMVEKKDVEKSKKEYEASKISFDNQRNKILELENSIKFIHENTKKLLKQLELDYINNLEAYITQLKNEKIELNTSKQRLENTLIILKEKKEFSKKLNEKNENISKEINILEKNIISKTTTIENLKKMEEDELSLLGDRDEALLKKELDERKLELTKIREYIEKTRLNYEEINSIYNRYINNIDIYSAELDENYNLDKALEIDKLNNYNTSVKEYREKFTDYISKLQNNNKQLEKLKYLSKEIEEIDRQYYNYQELNNVLSGQVRTLEKISFESFVQMKYLDEILIESNKRFYKMTDGKYSLLRKEEADNLSSKFGLEFEVYDHHNVQKRNINTLSGGESFQAALSLALGLSDVIQMQKGGIKLNSMFVDEGFGTLDNETLSKVMSILSKISQYDKLIGIISHVETLKEQIDNKIIVEKTNEGYSKLIQQM